MAHVLNLWKICMSCADRVFAKLGVYECRRREPRQLLCRPGHRSSMQDQGYTGLTTAPTSKQTANSRDLDINTAAANHHIPLARHPRIAAKSPAVIPNNPLQVCARHWAPLALPRCTASQYRAHTRPRSLLACRSRFAGSPGE